MLYCFAIFNFASQNGVRSSSSSLPCCTRNNPLIALILRAIRCYCSGYWLPFGKQLFVHSLRSFVLVRSPSSLASLVRQAPLTNTSELRSGVCEQTPVFYRFLQAFAAQMQLLQGRSSETVANGLVKRGFSLTKKGLIRARYNLMDKNNIF